jgi:hypothetical protein
MTDFGHYERRDYYFEIRARQYLYASNMIAVTRIDAGK